MKFPLLIIISFTFQIISSIWTHAIAESEKYIDLNNITIVVPADEEESEKIMAGVLVEELKKRTGIQVPVSTNWPDKGNVVAITLVGKNPKWKKSLQ